MREDYWSRPIDMGPLFKPISMKQSIHLGAEDYGQCSAVIDLYYCAQQRFLNVLISIAQYTANYPITDIIFRWIT